MAIINYKPTTNARRNMSTTDFSALSKTGPEKSLLLRRIKLPAATATAESPFATEAAATARSTV